MQTLIDKLQNGREFTDPEAQTQQNPMPDNDLEGFRLSTQRLRLNPQPDWVSYNFSLCCASH